MHDLLDTRPRNWRPTSLDAHQHAPCPLAHPYTKLARALMTARRTASTLLPLPCLGMTDLPSLGHSPKLGMRGGAMRCPWVATPPVCLFHKVEDAKLKK